MGSKMLTQSVQSAIVFVVDIISLFFFNSYLSAFAVSLVLRIVVPFIELFCFQLLSFLFHTLF